MSLPSIDSVASTPADRGIERSIERSVKDDQASAYGADGPAASAVDRRPQAPTRAEPGEKQDDRRQAEQERAEREEQAVRNAHSEESLARLREAAVEQRARSVLLDDL